MFHLGSQWDLDVDFISCGSGIGGITAALAAHDAGLKTIVLEKAHKAGGVSAYSGGEVFVPCNHVMDREGAPDDPAAAWAYLRFLAAGYGSEALARRLFELGPIAAHYLDEKCGVRWKTIRNFPDYYHPHAPGTAAHGRYLEVELFEGAQLGPHQKQTYLTPHVPMGITHDELFAWGSLSKIMTWDFKTMASRIRKDIRGFGPGMMGYLLKAAMIDRSIPVHLDAAAVQLIVEQGRVVGVVARQSGNLVRIRARRGVLIAMSGYDWRPDVAPSYELLPRWNSMVQPSVEGDNLVLGGEVGAAIAGVPSMNLGMFFGFQIPGEEHDGKPLWRASWEGGYPHAIWVNAQGERFCDEAFYKEYLPKVRHWDGKRQTQPNFPPYLIFDQNFRDKYCFGTYLPGMELPEAVVARANTPRELAEKLGIDGGGLEATLRRFNAMADRAVDDDFGRGTYPWAAMMTGDRDLPNPNLAPLTRAPFYGVRLEPVGAAINAVGLRTDEHGRVVHVRGHAIPGLYAAGNSAAPLDTGAGYQSGLSNLRGMAWGYAAAQHAAETAV
jgi:3-oxosteroid 1-dehydrogenase